MKVFILFIFYRLHLAYMVRRTCLSTKHTKMIEKSIARNDFRRIEIDGNDEATFSIGRIEIKISMGRESRSFSIVSGSGQLHTRV